LDEIFKILTSDKITAAGEAVVGLILFACGWIVPGPAYKREQRKADECFSLKLEWQKRYWDASRQRTEALEESEKSLKMLQECRRQNYRLRQLLKQKDAEKK
jgi:hypothetical protein